MLDSKLIGVRKRILPALIFWGAIATAASLFGREPDLNWDGIAYVALALERELGAEHAHQQSYAFLEEIAPAERFEELTSSSPYRAAMAGQPEAFAENLRFYRMRYGYVGLLQSSYRLTGVNPYLLSVAIGVAAFLLLAGAAWTWSSHAIAPLRREEAEWLRLAVLPLLLQPAALGAISLATPDLCAGALLAWGAFFLTAKRERGTAFLFFVLAVLCRPDALILGSLLFAADAFGAFLSEAGARAIRAPLGHALALALLGFFVTRTAEAHAWSTVFAHTFLEHFIVPDEVGLGPLTYLKVVATAILFLGSGVPARILFALAAIATAFLVFHPRVPQERWLFAGAALASWIAFFFLFPLPLERFYAAHVVILGSLLFQGLVDARALSLEGRKALGSFRASEWG